MSDIEYQKYYVAFLDILGFKSIIQRKSCKEIYDVFQKIKKPGLSFYNNNEILTDDSPIHLKILSDSIIMYIKASIDNALSYLLTECAVFQGELLSLNEPILLRGGISYGDLFFKDGTDIIYGEGLTKAYLLEEKNAKYPRIIIKKCDLDLSVDIQSVFTYLDDDAYYALNCYLSISKDNNAKAIIKNIWKSISYNLNTTDDNSVREKYLYLQKKMKAYKMGDYNV